MIKIAHGFTLIRLLCLWQRSCKAFTLIELLVVIAIIGTLIAVVLPQLNLFNRDQVLKNAAANLQSSIRKTQNNASSGLNCNGAGLAAKEWTINFAKDANSYTIAATCSDDNVGIGTTQQFPAGITISDIQFGTSTTSCNQASVMFKNISSAISFATTDVGCSSLVGGSKTSIYLSNTVGTGTTVVVEKGGSVY